MDLIASPRQQNLHQRRVAIQRRGHSNLQLIVFIGDLRGNPGQVTLQMQAQGQEVGDDDELAYAFGGKLDNGALQIRLAQLQEGSLHMGKAALPGDFRRDFSYGLISGLDPRTVRKNNDSGSHTLVFSRARSATSSIS